MTDLLERLKEALDETERIANAAASQCGCHPPTPSWTFADDDNDGRMVIEGDPHPDIRTKLTGRWNKSYHDLFAGRHIALNDPASVLRQVAAHRKLIAKHAEALAKHPAPPGRAAELTAEIHAFWTAITIVAEGYDITVEEPVS
jgi:hypothetical protein